MVNSTLTTKTAAPGSAPVAEDRRRSDARSSQTSPQASQQSLPQSSTQSSQRSLTDPATKGITQHLPITSFIWGAGIECSFLPHLNVDQFQWTQHNRYWRDDFKLASNELGINHLRYAFPWHELEPTRGQYNWKIADERIEEAQKLGLNLMVDVMHFGTPLWLKQAVGDPE